MTDTAADALLRVGVGRWPAGIGTKAGWLHRAARAGLNVPDAWLVPPGLAGSPGDAARALGRAGVGGAVAVRSAFAGEDGGARSMAGRFDSVLGVDAGDPAALAAALQRVVASAARGGAGRTDVLVMRMVAAVRAGVAFTDPEHEDDLVESVAGLADGLVRGAVRGEVTELPKLRGFERRAAPVHRDPAWARLQGLLRGLRRLFGRVGLDVEWADDGERAWLIQVRPVTAPPLRDELFTIANHKEILPELPSRLMTDVLRASADGLFAWYRRFDAELPRRRPFLEVFHGRPRINLSLLTDTMRIWGLPTRLVTDSIGGGGGDRAPLRPARVVRKLPVLARFGLAQLRAVPASRRLRARLLARSAELGVGFGDAGRALCDVYVALVHGMFGLTAAMSAPLALLRRAGTLDRHGATHETVTTRMWADLDALRGRLDGVARAACAGAAWPDDPAAARVIRGWLDRHGHRGVFESDVARPRFAEDPTPVLRALATPPAERPARPRRGLRGALTWPLWVLARRPLAAREALRADAMRAFLTIRRRLLALAEAAVEDGRLPERSAVWDLDLAELDALDRGERLGAEFLRARRREIDADRAVRLPDLFHRRDPLGALSASGGDAGTLRGLGLTQGRAEGVAWVADEPTDVLPRGCDPRRTILVAPAIDAGWIPLLSSVAGAVVETGGELSHGSIVLREVGLPAVTDVGGARTVLRTGDAIAVCGRTGVVERLGAGAAECGAARQVAQVPA